MLSIINNNQDLTMSSAQLALLTSKRVDSVKRTMETLSDKGLITFTQSVEKATGGRPTSVYNVNERDSYVVVAQLSPEFTAFLVDEWQKVKAAPVLTQEQQVLMIAQQLIETTKQRDEAIKTKAHINDKRTATVMGKLGAATKKIKSLESKFQDVGTRLSLKGAKLPERIDTEFKSNVQTWRVLKQLSLDMNQSIEKVEDSNYGSVNTYHIDVIEAFKSEYL